MPLHLITGRANAGKTGELNARLLASLARGESPVLVLPSVADTRRAVIEFSEKAPTGVAIVTLRRWADGLWRLHGDGRRIIGDASREAFVRRAIAEVEPEALSEVSASTGFSAIVIRTVMTVGDSARQHRRCLRGDAGRGAHMRALSGAHHVCGARRAGRGVACTWCPAAETQRSDRGQQVRALGRAGARSTRRTREKRTTSPCP